MHIMILIITLLDTKMEDIVRLGIEKFVPGIDCDTIEYLQEMVLIIKKY